MKIKIAVQYTKLTQSRKMKYFVTELLNILLCSNYKDSCFSPIITTFILS